KLNQYQYDVLQRRLETARELASRCGQSLVICSTWRKHHIDNKKNSSANRFFCCDIHATDSTLTGCTANSNAPSQAPGIFSRCKIAHSNNVPAMCKSKLTT